LEQHRLMTDAERNERLGGTFAECLHFLLFRHGCRPACSPGKRGEAWSRKGFAGELGVSVRAVGFWLSGERTPDDLASIERVLFGSNEQFDPWKGLLRAAYHRARTGGVVQDNPTKQYNGSISLQHGAILHPDIRHVPGFVGREDLLAGIEQTLWQRGGTAALTNDTASAAVKGLGGVGKSVLAREYAWRTRGRYHGVWWVRAETEQTLIDDLIDLGSQLIANLKEMPERDRALHLALAAVEGCKAKKPWLIVYDDVEKPDVIARLTPKTSAHVLITSRWARWQGHAQELAVEVFPEATAVDFLLAERPHETRDAAGRLAAALGFLPSALSHARSYCLQQNCSFSEYTARAAPVLSKSSQLQNPLAAEMADAKRKLLIIQELGNLLDRELSLGIQREIVMDLLRGQADDE
jgi:hypothetical protein